MTNKRQSAICRAVTPEKMERMTERKSDKTTDLTAEVGQSECRTEEVIPAISATINAARFRATDSMTMEIGTPPRTTGRAVNGITARIRQKARKPWITSLLTMMSRAFR